MIRNFTKIPLNKFKQEHGIRTVHQVELFIDNESFNDISELMGLYKDGFQRALYEMVMGRYNNDLYGKEEISNKTKGVTAIKFKRKQKNNFRIYCREFIDDIVKNRKKIVMITVHNKKSQGLTKKEKTIIASISKYEYEFKD